MAITERVDSQKPSAGFDLSQLGLGRRRIYPDGRYIFHQGDPTNRMLALVRGRVALSIQNSEGGRVVLDTLHSPTIFGDGVFLDQEHSTDAHAIGSAEVASFDPSIFRQQPELMKQVLIHFAKYSRRRIRFYQNLVSTNVFARVTQFLLDQAENGELSGYTQTQIGEHVAAGRRAVHVALSKMQKRGITDLRKSETSNRKDIVIISPDGLLATSMH